MCTEVVSGERRTTKWERKSFQEVFVEHRRSVERTTRRNEMSEGRKRAECAKRGTEKRKLSYRKDFGGSLWNVDGDRSPTAQERGGNGSTMKVIVASNKFSSFNVHFEVGIKTPNQ
ncbi:hypothetical protein MTP99_015383 [Tenebrio molitor]|nr:hypothetical protein MTP99_015383 [Tenebrio molitor]